MGLWETPVYDQWSEAQVATWTYDWHLKWGPSCKTEPITCGIGCYLQVESIRTELNDHPGELLENCLFWGRYRSGFWVRSVVRGTVVRGSCLATQWLRLWTFDAGMQGVWVWALGGELRSHVLARCVGWLEKKKVRNKGGGLRFLRCRSISLTNKDETLLHQMLANPSWVQKHIKRVT